MSYTRTYTHTVEGNSKATGGTNADDDGPSATTLPNSLHATGTFDSTTPNIVDQVSGLKCHLQVDVVRQGEAAADDSKIRNAALAELIRSAASEEETTQGTDSNVKSVYIRVEFNN